MNKFLLAAAVATATLMPVSAQETVKTLYSGEPVNVTWDNTLTIPAEDFADGISTGNYIYITFENTSDVIEVKANGTWLPGSIKTTLGDNASDFRLYLTDAGLNTARQYGIEICGASFTVKEVSVMNDGFAMPDNAIWGGYFWVSDWNTLELFKTAFDEYADQRYLNINFSADKGDFTNYDINVMTAFDNPAALWAGNDKADRNASQAVIDLDGINVADALADVSALFIQMNPGPGNAPFNITSVTLSGTLSSISSVIAADNDLVNVYNMQGVAVRTAVNAADATVGLPAGLYIISGRKVLVK